MSAKAFMISQAGNILLSRDSPLYYLVDSAKQHPSSSFRCCGFDNSADTASSVVDIKFVEPTKGNKHVSPALIPKICSSDIRDRYPPRVLKINMVLVSEESDLFHR
jgi:hypothetical protein